MIDTGSTVVAHSKTRRTRGDEQAVDDLDILILGPIPPPFGGISVHLSRLVPKLQRSGLKVGVLNHFGSTAMPFVMAALSRNPLNYYRVPKRFPARIVHYHHSRWPYLVALALGKGSSPARYILTLHSGDIQKHFPSSKSRTPFVGWITRWALRHFDTIICVDPKIASFIRGHLDRQRLEVLPAFLESPDHEAEEYDATIETFLKSGRVLVVAAYGVQFLQDGREVYGVDTAVEAFSELAQEQEDLRLVIFVARRPSRGKPRRHLARLERRLEEAGVRDRVLIVFDCPLVPALRENSVFVRPTRAEGDAVSVREARRAGIPVIASDVVRRPRGVILFSGDDVTELCVALRAVLDGAIQPEDAATIGDGSDDVLQNFSDRLIDIYRTELPPPAGFATERRIVTGN
jgi:glycosyltransferase involved in cell wall biosynthesis